jgi:spermidine/putrescine transport system permease protein
MKSKVLSIPYLLWMLFFTLAPLGVVVFFALTDRNGAFTLDNILFIQGFLPIFLNSVMLALIASLICLAIGYPVAYYMSRVSPTKQRFFMILVMLPMCMSFLLRTMALVSLLGDTGIINHFLGQVGIGPLPLIRNNGAVVFGMVYNFVTPVRFLPRSFFL